MQVNLNALKQALFTFAGRISASREGSDVAVFDEAIALAIAEEKNAAGDSLAGGRKLTEKVNKALKHAYAPFAKSTRTIVYGIDFAAITWHNVPESVLKIAKCTKFLYAIDILFEIPSLFRTTRRAISNYQLISGLGCLLSASRIAGYSIRVISACRDVGIVEQQAFSWTRKAVKVLFGMRILGLVLFVFDLSKLDKRNPTMHRIQVLLKISDVAITGLMIFTPATPALYAAAIIESLCGLIMLHIQTEHASLV